MKHWHRFTLLLLSITSGLLGQSGVPNYFEQHYLFQERLAKGLVFDIHQDKQGFLWFATEYGLVRYDGHTQKTYQYEPNNPHSLAGNVITCLAEDAVGNLWIGTMHNGLHYLDRQTNRFINYQHNANDTQSIGHNKIKEVLVASNGSVWITTAGGGVQLFNPQTAKFQRFQQPLIKSGYTDALFEDSAGRIWLGGYFGISYWLPDDSSFVFQAQISPAGGSELKVIAQDAEGNIWSGFQNSGLKYLDLTKSQFREPQSTSTGQEVLRNGHIWDLYVDQEKDLWVASDGGLYFLQHAGAQATHSISQYTLSQERRYLSLHRSTDGVMWVGTNDGVVVLAPKHKQFQHYVPLKAGESLETKRGVTSISAGQNNQIWVGTNQGIFQFDRERQRIHQDFLTEHPALLQFDQFPISALYQDQKNHLWIARIKAFDAGFELYTYDPQEKSLRNLSNRSLLFHSFATFSITEDHFGHLWFANQRGLIQYIPEADSIQVFQHDTQKTNSLSSNQLNQVLITGKDSLWLATNDAGLSFYHISNDQYSNLDALAKKTTTACNKRIITLMKDEQNHLWLGTTGGLASFDPVSGDFTCFDTRNGLADNVIKSLNRYRDGPIWIGSKGSLSRFDSKKEVFTNFNANDGLEMEEFWDRSSYCDEDGQFYFGGDDGLLVFHPDSIQDNAFLPPIVFTKFMLFNQEIIPNLKDRVLPLPLFRNPEIQLRYDQNVFSIEWAGLSYINPQKNRYAIKMDGFEEAWQTVGLRTEATYTNLDPGNYSFQVKAANSDGIWNEEIASLQLIVLPPWYRTWLAYLLYLVLFCSAVYFLYRFQLKRELAQAESRRLRELNAVKTQLYTNITHEFRTPLTLIQGPVERALQEPSFALGKIDLERIRQNCQRLLHLIRQMLQLNKLEVRALQTAYRYANIIPAIQYIFESFSSFAESQEVLLKLRIPNEAILMDFDQEKLLDILSNLISNAIKFTKAGGTITVVVEKIIKSGADYLEVNVIDSGTGIPKAEIEKIFDRFYQIDQIALGEREESTMGGAGIGLALSKNLAELMGGTITVESIVGKGSTFCLQLPIREVHREISGPAPLPSLYVPQGGLPIEMAPHAKDLQDKEGPSILIVEDNAEVAHFIANCLPNNYNKQIASNGQEGINRAIEYIPDLIISDVLMPKLNGYVLTSLLKKDHRTSHIPIILLTAKVDLESKIEGLKKGADAYLAKPFNRRELLIRIENLLASRRRLQTFYLQQSEGRSSTLSGEILNPREHAFLKNVRQLVKDHLEEGNYSVEQLASDLHMSSSQLYRKMIALTGQGPIKFFRNIQISLAKQLLLESDLPISQIAYQSGFNDPAYFTRVFTAEMGQAPSSYRNKEL